ncbi:pilus assembly protein TadG-related protein [Sphaerisporangium sp. TRM90804]|uniref:pilus assembly protein TadG-related protein n=1 Tax=Sphaerisporangium sp. TRM90804 TaxID=3031113 RepID=UPI002447E42F|nr:pilus assembly protein TadG-related protein [Sphaerisporangium sp. TRM90804]MDH2423955.1 pilus assembly protein TadG-related protein [Sphaerisporangium sp. TRM90804]
MSDRPLPPPARRPGDRGSMSVFVVLFSVVVFMLAGLLVDGGAAINARLRASDVAEQAARAAADEIDEEHLRSTGQVRLVGDEGAVCGRARKIVGAHDDTAVRLTECRPGQGQTVVTVAVSVRWNAFFLAAFGFSGSDMSGTATAGPDSGDAP